MKRRMELLSALRPATPAAFTRWQSRFLRRAGIARKKSRLPLSSVASLSYDLSLSTAMTSWLYVDTFSAVKVSANQTAACCVSACVCNDDERETDFWNSQSRWQRGSKLGVNSKCDLCLRTNVTHDLVAGNNPDYMSRRTILGTIPASVYFKGAKNHIFFLVSLEIEFREPSWHRNVWLWALTFSFLLASLAEGEKAL